MELIEQILSQSNLKEAICRVKINKGAPGVNKRTVDELDSYFKKHQAEIKDAIMKMNIVHKLFVESIYLKQMARNGL